MRLVLPDMTCGHCQAAVEAALARAAPGARVRVDLDRREVRIDGAADRAAVAAALAAAGYPPAPA